GHSARRRRARAGARTHCRAAVEAGWPASCPMNPMDFLDEFQAEANEKLDTIATQLLRLERDASNTQPVREMFLAAHTVKGGAAMLRLTAVETLAHGLEDLL